MRSPMKDLYEAATLVFHNNNPLLIWAKLETFQNLEN